MYDVAIIGSGPAGLSASIYAKRAGLHAVTLEQNPMSGGQVLNTYEVDNYPGLPGINGFDLGMKFREHADKLGCEFREAVVEAVKENAQGFTLVTDVGELQAKTVLAAMGATHAKLNIPGEEELSGMGVSYCATCDGAFFRGRVTAVIGGGDVAVEDAIFLARGCEKVYLIHRRDELRAAAVLQKELMALPNVEVIWDTVVEKISGEDQVDSLLIKNVKTGEKKALLVDGVFVAVGIIPSGGLLQDLVDCDEKGYLIAGEDCATSRPGIFVAGDLRKKKLRQIVTAVSDGANAITSILDYLLNHVE
ncbi:MAG: FAD-dependent oxidoreductase [Lachnospiraceae bacterium]|nr:FAD-dependent oxidoreductase [Lachnospiraceae bacterium]